jgi:CheY-like chemotaxis protein
MAQSLRILLVEDEALLLMQLELFLEDEGHVVVGTAVSSAEAMELASRDEADIALVDIHLADGPLGCEVGRFITQNTRTAVVFMTANPKRIPDDFSGAVGVIGKPYTHTGMKAALAYLVSAVSSPPPTIRKPPSLTLAPAFEQEWRAESGPA